MENTALIFDRQYALLGEVTSHGGAFGRAMLTVEGERQLGAHVSDWQLRGVPVLREILVTEPQKHSTMYYQERVQVRDAEFIYALRRWLEGHGMALVAVTDDVLRDWQSILRLPLEPRERFSMIVTLRTASAHELESWRAKLALATKAVEKETEKMNKAIADLRERTLQNLLSAFAKKKTS